MKKLQVAVIGYGHVGKAAIQALEVADDLQFVGLVDRKEVLAEAERLHRDVEFSDHVSGLSHVDVALLCIPSRLVPTIAPDVLREGISTVDCFDIHGAPLGNLRAKLDQIAREMNRVSITACGWDPGIDSIVRGLFLACAPRGITYTNHGPGISLGHSVAARAIPGVRDAMSVTIPTGSGHHRRQVYVVLEDGENLAEVTERIRNDAYFSRDELVVQAVDSLDSYYDNGHGVLIERKGVAGQTHNQMMKFELRITNPALTAQVMVSAARAVSRLQAGCHTMLDVPIGYLLPKDPAYLAEHLV